MKFQTVELYLNIEQISIKNNSHIKNTAANKPATPKSAAFSLTDAKYEEAKGIDVTIDETIIPKVLDTLLSHEKYYQRYMLKVSRKNNSY